ncbi:BirA family transcriptional regulator, biotin operon repressor / biotin-[acetyl-CoA-carboxylase] ligase [Paraoerskovia marina]|uniref:biotin--[biotin carboxyl-carrier protein] ligase n=1 Tax=Paraoerskovia marina TaxID=545619 RepID=A0A1H1UIN5_9CELL|nr:biotin--[acetyl-CoA-carboxylase] ligase [Paraoerskovia marina]SDS72313.1 BirA family transcriptional regulator, biotin operon repressor / biotin-[acetyl-CoA-carboxylase] ligase [Paraoerskovia marina]
MEKPDRPALAPDLLHSLLVGPGQPVRRLEVLETVDSTSGWLAREALVDPSAWPHPALVVADHQQAGRGRQGREWVVPERAAITASLLLRPPLEREALTWLPLLAGLSVARGLRATAGVHAVVKWPNDVLVPVESDDGAVVLRKVAGLLADVLTDGAVVVGFGVNVTQSSDELPVETATSLLLAGAATTDRAIVLTALIEGFSEVLGRWVADGGDVQGSGLAAECAELCVTLGRRVRVELPDGTAVEGVAERLGATGSLVVSTVDGEQEFHAGDVHHLRDSEREHGH